MSGGPLLFYIIAHRTLPGHFVKQIKEHGRQVTVQASRPIVYDDPHKAFGALDRIPSKLREHYAVYQCTMNQEAEVVR